jgi:hypothetical protein
MNGTIGSVSNFDPEKWVNPMDGLVDLFATAADWSGRIPGTS